MNEIIKLRNNTIANIATPEGNGESSTLQGQRADIDRLFAVASQAFAGLNLGNSQEFIDSSRQTGGQ